MKETRYKAYYKDGVDGTKIRNITSLRWTKTKGLIADLEGGGTVSVENILRPTGLKNKNGVEIYEGDIVQFHSFIKAPTESDYFGTGVIEYRPDFMMFVISQKNRDWTYEETSDIDEDCIEVIGNIYENPELLEK